MIYGLRVYTCVLINIKSIDASTQCVRVLSTFGQRCLVGSWSNGELWYTRTWPSMAFSFLVTEYTNRESVPLLFVEYNGIIFYLEAVQKHTSLCVCPIISTSQIARFMGPRWGPQGPVGPRWAPWTLLSGIILCFRWLMTSCKTRQIMWGTSKEQTNMQDCIFGLALFRA